jgi:glucose-6-phosphate isomerase
MVLLPTISSQQAWSILVRHARETNDLRLDSLCADADRVAALVEAYTASNDGTIILDLSRQRMTEGTVNHLLGLARSRHLYEFIQQLAWGQNDPKAPIHKQPTSASPTKEMDDNEESVASILHPHLAHFKESKLATAALANANVPPKLDTSAVTMDSEVILGQASQPQSLTRPQHMHMAMRVPRGRNHVMFDHNAYNVLTDIHKEWGRIERFSEAVRLGALVSADNQLFRDVLVVGKGTAVAALEFIHHALQCDESALLSSRLGLGSNATEFMTLPRIRSHLTGTPWQLATATVTPRKLHFLKSVDPVTIAKVTSALDPGCTMVISIALQGNEDTGIVTKLLKQWMLDYHHHKKSSSSPDHVLSKHMILVTANQRIASVINKPESVYVIPAHSRCEPLINFSAATLLVR